jgi:hypothetical protein
MFLFSNDGGIRMKKILLVSLCLVMSVSLVASLAFAKNVSNDRYSTYKPEKALGSTVSLDQDMSQLSATAAVGTTQLAFYSFDSGGSCVDEGWVGVDITAQDGDFWHVDDWTGMSANYQGNVGPLGGSGQSLWCGARAIGTGPLCGYLALPGYGNSWNQAFCTTNCVSASGAVIAFDADWDSEPGYDATTLEVTNCTGGVSDENWIVIAGGVNDWDYNLDLFSTNGDTSMSIGIADSLHTGSFKVRFHFVADGGWSDSDGQWDTDGAFALDNLSLTGLNGGAVETFEDESVGDGATTDNAWSSCTPQGYGDFSGLYNMLSDGVEQYYPYQCGPNYTCVWAFYNGSTANYTCGGFAAQTAVGYENPQGQYINNEIWSPVIPNIGVGVQYELAFDSFRDLPLDNLLFYVWHVQSIVGGCGGQWLDRNFVYYGPNHDWLHVIQPCGDLISGAATDVRVAIGCVDMCPFWCGIVGSGACHSHAPLIDNVELYRIESVGAQWAVRDLEFFQDTFATDGTTTGTARLDMANDILPSGNPNFRSGDSMTVGCADPEVGLISPEPYSGSGTAVYGFFSLQRAGANPPDAAWEAPEVGYMGPKYPVIAGLSYNDANSVHWVCVRMDTSFTDGVNRTGKQPDKWAVDLNDNLFVPGDTISFYFGAQSVGGGWTYHSLFTGGTDTQTLVEAAPNEVTILPAGGWARGGDILYVDGMDGRGAQQFFDTAFNTMGLLDKIDRYDIRAPSSGVANRPGSRVVDVFQQLLPCYRKIIWDTGNLDQGLIGDGTTTGEKSDDAGMLYTFLDNLAAPGGVYFSGDNIAEDWPTLLGSAIPLQGTFMQHQLVSPDYLALNSVVNPLVIGELGGCFAHVTGPDTLIAFGGCALYNDFDVIRPLGPATQEMKYVPGAAGSNGAVVAQYTVNGASQTVCVILSGFGFQYISNNDHNNLPARAHHMYDILVWLGNNPPTPVAATPTYRNTLSQNYPNPFNPQTSIEFTVKELAPVNVKIYNVRGQLVKTLANDRFAPGTTHTLHWDGRNDAGQQVSSGVYFYKLVTNNFTQTKKMVLLK